jgi:hypothetical protein
VDLVVLVVVAVVGTTAVTVAHKLGWIDLTGSRTGRNARSGAGLFGAIDEVFQPTRHEAQQELDRQSSLPAPAPVPGDRGRRAPIIDEPDTASGVIHRPYAGRVTISLDD